MKTKMYIAALAALCMVTFSSCNTAETIIQKETEAANLQCPIHAGAGMTITSVRNEGRYITYYVKGDDKLYFFSQDLVTNELKTQLISTLKTQAAQDKSVKRLLKALDEEHVGIMYHYYTSNSSMDVYIMPLEISSMVNN